MELKSNLKDYDLPDHCRLVEYCGWRPIDPEGLTASYGDFQNINPPYDAKDPSTVYAMPEYLSGSDYSGGFVSKANFKDFEDETESQRVALGIVEVYGGHGTYGWAIPLRTLRRESCPDCQDPEDGDYCDPCAMCYWIRETLDSLENYPLINDETMSFLEQEDWEVQWESWGRDDFQKETESRYPVDLDDVLNEDIDELFYALCEDSGTYPEPDGESMYVRMETVLAECSFQDVAELPGVVVDIDDEEWEEDRSEIREMWFQGFRYRCVFTSPPDGENVYFDRARSAQNHGEHMRKENPLTVRYYVERIDGSPERNETPLLPKMEDAETPRKA